MSGRGDDEARISKVAWEQRHWIEYGVFAFVLITAMATTTAAWYTRKQWESTADNGHRQLRAYVFPEQANLVWQGAAKPTAAEIVIRNSGQTSSLQTIKCDNDFGEGVLHQRGEGDAGIRRSLRLVARASRTRKGSPDENGTA
jgi:hypothetical protein